MAQTVAQAYDRLPPAQRADCAILTRNYGEAGAVDFFGQKLGLPPAISGHENYFYWGPRGYTGQTVLMLGYQAGELSSYFKSVEKVGTVEHPYAMPQEHFDLFLCRGSKFGSLQEIWPKLKYWD